MSSTKRLVLIFLAVLLIGRYYVWQGRTSADRVDVPELNGYYDMLARAFLNGHLYLPVDPAPEMLRLANPWDPKQNAEFRLHDTVLFNGRYYLYHGVVPAVLAFVPWRLVLHRDLQQEYALAAMLFAGMLFWTGAVARTAGLKRAGVIAVLAMGLSSGAPYMLNRVGIYEIAIGGGFLCLGAAVFFLAGRQPALAGLCFGLAVGCRPHLIFVGAIAFLWMLVQRRPRPELFRFAAAMAVVGTLLAWYNYARFGNPFEFGMRYMLAAELSHQKLNISMENVIPSAWYYLWSPPDWSPVFPWARPVMHLPQWIVYPKGYFLEGTVGLLFFAPAALLAVFSKGLGRAMAIAGAVILFFHLTTGFTTERYFIDFVPLLLFAAAVSSPAWLFAPLVVWGALMNMAIALHGPWNDYFKTRPDSYLRLAQRFSPVPRHRLVKDPPLDVTLEVRSDPMPDGKRQPLLSLGRNAYRYVLWIEHSGGKVRVMSTADPSTVEIASGLPETAPLRVHIQHEVGSQTMRISVNGAPAVEHKTGMLISAPSQIAIGANDRFDYSTMPKFGGEVKVYTPL